MAETELMARWVNPRVQILLQDLGLLLLRVGAGAMMVTHGWPKYTSYGEKSAGFTDPLGVGGPMSLALAVFAELVCAVLVIFGLATRLAALVVAINFSVIVMVVHGVDPFKKKELAVAYLLMYAVLVLTGPGRFSLDALLKHLLMDRKQPAAKEPEKATVGGG